MKKNFIAIKKEFITKAKCKSLIKTLDKNLITDGNEYSNYEFKDIKDINDSLGTETKTSINTKGY